MGERHAFDNLFGLMDFHNLFRLRVTAVKAYAVTIHGRKIQLAVGVVPCVLTDAGVEFLGQRRDLSV